MHHMVSKASVKARPSVLWCFKKDLGFSSHRKKKMKHLQKKIKSGKLDVDEEDPMTDFVSEPTYTSHDTAIAHRITKWPLALRKLSKMEGPFSLPDGATIVQVKLSITL